MLDINDKTFGLISHPYWTELLNISADMSKDPVFLISKKGPDYKAKLLQLVLDGFYPLGNISCPTFKQIEITSDGEAEEFVRPIYEADAGKRPLIKGTKYAKMTHPAQFKLFIESLMDNINLSIPTDLKNRLLEESKIKKADLSESIGCGCAVENAAPGIIFGMQDFASKWQVFNHRTSSKIEYNFVYEHGLIEGSEAEEQHIYLVDNLLRKFEGRVDLAKLQMAAKHFVTSYHKILDEIMLKVNELLNG